MAGEKVSIPRDNVIFELGLFIGALGKERTFLVCPEDAPRLPSDLQGIVHVQYRERDDGNFEAAVRPGVFRIVREIEERGRRDRWGDYIT
jgi:predicted nucleotide-binding protein